MLNFSSTKNKSKVGRGQIRHITKRDLKNNKMETIIGIKFLEISKLEQTFLQKHILFIEREKRMFQTKD